MNYEDNCVLALKTNGPAIAEPPSHTMRYHKKLITVYKYQPAKNCNSYQWNNASTFALLSLIISQSRSA